VLGGRFWVFENRMSRFEGFLLEFWEVEGFKGESEFLGLYLDSFI
jgi:hypothetical protein